MQVQRLLRALASLSIALGLRRGLAADGLRLSALRVQSTRNAADSRQRGVTHQDRLVAAS
jgi:hypothetical protein